MSSEPEGPISYAEAKRRLRRREREQERAASDEAPGPSPDDDGATWPGGFDMEPEGLFRRDPRSDEKPREWVSSPFRVLAETRPELGDDWGLLLAWQDADGREHRAIVAQATLAGDERTVFQRLAARGIRITGTRSGRAALTECLARVRSTKKARTVTRIGWCMPPAGGAAFVLPDRVCGTLADGEELFLNIDPPPRVFRERGTLDAWKRGIAARCVGNSRLVLAVAVAFAGPLLTPLGEETGGIHFRGGSSVGKTTALHLTASAWGAPSGPDAFVRQWRATINGVEEMAKTYSDGVLPLDEIGQADPTKVGDMVYMLANEAGSARMRDRGGLRTMNTWRLLFVSTGEEGIVTLMNRGKVAAKAGQETRFLDIPADAGCGLGMFEKLHDAENGALFSRELKQAAQDLHGVAGPAFAAWLAPRVSDAAWLDATRARLHGIAAAMLPHGADGQVQRAAGRFALIALAGELATEANVTGWPLGEATRGAEACFSAWLEGRGSVGPLELRNLLRSVKTFLTSHGASRFETLKEPNAPGDLGGPVTPPETRTIERAGWRWNEAGLVADGAFQWVHGIQPETFEKEVVPAGMSELEAKRMLAGAGVLRTQTKGSKLRFTVRKSVKGVGRPELITILPSIFDDEGDEG